MPPASSRAPRPLTLLALLVSTQLWLGCASAGKADPGRKLPFHVAVIPVSPQDVRVAARAGGEIDEEGEDDVVVHFDGRAISQGVVDELGNTTFAATTLLEPPANDPSGAPVTSWAEVGDAYWIEAAERVGADLLLHCEAVSYDPAAPSRRVNFLSSSLPLFLLGGPFVYFIDDRGYAVDVRLSANLYDLNQILQSRDPGDPRTELDKNFSLESFEARPEEVRLTFNERTSSDDVGSYGASLLVPTGFLGSDNETVRAALSERAVASLSENLASQIRGRRREILDPGAGLASFHLEPRRVQLRPAENGTLGITAQVALRRSKNTSGLARSTVYVDGRPVEGVVRPAGQGPNGEELWTVEAQAPLPQTGGRVRLSITDQGTVSNTRSWTFLLSRAGAEDAAVGDRARSSSGREAGSP